MNQEKRTSTEQSAPGGFVSAWGLRHPVCVVKTQLMFKIDGLHSRPVVAEGTVAAC
jgi:hypothetical protein